MSRSATLPSSSWAQSDHCREVGYKCPLGSAWCLHLWDNSLWGTNWMQLGSGFRCFTSNKNSENTRVKLSCQCGRLCSAPFVHYVPFHHYSHQQCSTLEEQRGLVSNYTTDHLSCSISGWYFSNAKLWVCSDWLPNAICILCSIIGKWGKGKFPS